MRAPSLRQSVALATITLALFTGCETAEHAQHVIHETHAPRITAIVHEDIERADRGLTAASERIGRGFVVEDPTQRAREMRRALELLT